MERAGDQHARNEHGDGGGDRRRDELAEPGRDAADGGADQRADDREPRHASRELGRRREPDRDAGEELDRAEESVHSLHGRSLAEPLAERRDLGDAGAGHRHERDGGHRPAALAEAHVEVEQRSLAESLEQPAVARLGRAVADDAVVERRRVDDRRAAAPAAVTT